VLSDPAKAGTKRAYAVNAEGAEIGAELLATAGPWWKGMGNFEAVNLTRRRGDAEEETEKAKKEMESRVHASGGVAERAENVKRGGPSFARMATPPRTTENQ